VRLHSTPFAADRIYALLDPDETAGSRVDV
jgi:hypothetical protein